MSDARDDIVRRLRELAEQSGGGFDLSDDHEPTPRWSEPDALLMRAADEIERLRADRDRLDWLAKHRCDASIRVNGTLDVKAVNAWGIASDGADLREAIDAVMAAEKGTTA